MANFALDVNSSDSEIVSSLNYALATLGTATGNALIADTGTGTITNSYDNIVVSYLYQFINVRYATASDGSTGFSTSPTNATYYGLRNSSTATASSNPTDYIWYEATGGFGTTKFLFYSTYGGYQIQWYVGTAAPDSQFVQTVDGVAIDLAVITSTGALAATTASVNPTIISFPQNANGTYTIAGQTMTATFSNASTTSVATIQANLFANGNIIVSNVSVDPGIGITVANNLTNDAVVTFTQGNVATSGQISSQSYPVAVLSTTGGANIVSSGATITTIATPATLVVNYPQGQYVIQGNGGAFTPAAVGNVVTLNANVQALRAGNLIAAVTQEALYFTANGNYSIVSNTASQFNSNLFTFSSPYSTTYNAYQDITYSDSGGTVNGIVSVALIINGSAGNVGPQGERGPIPLAYIVTDGDPTTASQVQLDAWFQAPRDNTAPPIGMGIIQLAGDTAQFFYPNVASVYGGTTVVATYDGTDWGPVAAQVVSGNVLYTGSITADRLNTNDVYTLKVRSTNSTFANNQSLGFWLNSANGDARFAGNTSIGNDLAVGDDATIADRLIVGNNAIIGGNLTIGANLSVAGLVSAGTLVANTVTAGALTANSVSSPNIQYNAVTNNQLANLAVGTRNIQVAAVDTAAIANAVITEAKMANAAISTAKIQLDAITNQLIAANAISSSKLQDAAVQTSKIANAAVITQLIATGAVTNAQIATNTITAGQIAPATITGAKIAGQTITNVQIANNTISNTQIAAKTITGSLIADQTITGSLITNQTITGSLIAGQTITGSLIATSTITGSLIATNTITNDLIATGTITGSKIAAGTISATNIQAGTITASQIAAGTITASQIQSGTITATQIAAGTITATQIAADTITADRIAAATITGQKIAANTIATTNLQAYSITTDRLAANLVVSQDVKSTAATVGDNNSAGYWLQGSTGNARFAGNVSIGNSLYVGNIIVASNIGVGVVGAINIAPGVIPGQAGISFNIGSATVGPTAASWDGLTNSGYYYKILGYVRITPATTWVTGSTTPRIGIQTSARISNPSYTPAAGYPRIGTYGVFPAYGGNNIAPIVNGYTFNEYSFQSLSGGSSIDATYGYTTNASLGGTSFWSNSYPSTFGIYMFGRGDNVALNGTTTVANVVCNITIVSS